MLSFTLKFSAMMISSMQGFSFANSIVKKLYSTEEEEESIDDDNDDGDRDSIKDSLVLQNSRLEDDDLMA